MWHLAPEDAPTSNAEEIARDLHAWLTDQDFPWRRPLGGLPVAPAAEGFSLAVTLRMAMGRRGGATATRPLDSPAVVLTHGHPGPCRPSRQGGLPTATPPRRGPAPQLGGRSGLGTVKGGGRAPEPVFPAGAGPGATPRLGHKDRGVGGDRARHGMQVDHCGRPATNAIATGVPPPPTGGPLLGTPPRPHDRSVEGGLSHPREWMTNPAARCPPGLVYKQLPAPTTGVRHALHRASARTEQLTDEVLDLALQLLRLLYPQTHIPPVGTSNCLGRPGLQRRFEGAHPGGVVELWLILHNPSTAKGHWYLHQLLFLPLTAPEHRRQNPYHTHPERLGVQSFPQPATPALPPGQNPGALQQGPPLHTATTVQQRGRNNADGAEPDRRNCGVLACMAPCRHLARNTTGLRQYRPTGRTALTSTVGAVTMGPVAA